ncbi:hypothetical protein C8R45DRAFT_933404 [Mycena sanguinolenta]|nr:hypothetical protein C8R45DRAFT_933404 [Mycena sanguinolenta]
MYLRRISALDSTGAMGVVHIMTSAFINFVQFMNAMVELSACIPDAEDYSVAAVHAFLVEKGHITIVTSTVQLLAISPEVCFNRSIETDLLAVNGYVLTPPTFCDTKLDSSARVDDSDVHNRQVAQQVPEPPGGCRAQNCRRVAPPSHWQPFASYFGDGAIRPGGSGACCATCLINSKPQ